MNAVIAQKLSDMFQTVEEFREAARFMAAAVNSLDNLGLEDEKGQVPSVSSLAYWYLNDAGREYVRKWLIEHVKVHSKRGEVYDDELRAYENEAIQSWENGNGLEFEVLSFCTISGHTELCRIDEEFLEFVK